VTDPPSPPDPDALHAEIRAIAATVDRDALRLDLADPALSSLVDRAVAPYEHALTPEGIEEARETALFALITRPDVDGLLERERARLARQGSGAQVKDTVGATARRRPGRAGR